MRIRTIKPDFYSDEELCELPALTRILFTGLWGLSDSEGRQKYRPRFIKVQVLPYDECDIEAMLAALSDRRFIQIYDVAGHRYIQVVHFKKHQRISGKEAEIKSVLPAPPPMRETTGKRSGKNGKHRGSNGEAPGKHLGSNGEAVVVQEGKGRERKGRERSPGVEIAPAVPGVAVAGLSPQAEFVERFKASYESMTGQPFKMDKRHFVMAATLIRTHGYETVVGKAKTLGLLCRDRSAWFTKGGWADYTIEKLSSQWNSIIPGAAHDSAEAKAHDLLAEMKKQEELRAIADAASL